jgi:hypothetical protein
VAAKPAKNAKNPCAIGIGRLPPPAKSRQIIRQIRER